MKTNKSSFSKGAAAYFAVSISIAIVFSMIAFAIVEIIQPFQK